MLFIAAWDRPSTWMLAGVLTANVALPVTHFWGAGDLPAAAEARSANAVAQAPSSAIEPIRVALPDRRPAPAASTAAVPARLCLAWGPFTKASEAQSMASRLDLVESTFEIRASEVPAPPDYLVTVHTPGSRDDVRSTLQTLAAHHVDSYVLERRDDGSVLAAGVFSAPGRAQSQRRRLRELGYSAEVQPLGRTREVYHLLAEVPAGREPEIPAVAACDHIAPQSQVL